MASALFYGMDIKTYKMGRFGTGSLGRRLVCALAWDLTFIV